MVGIRRKTKAKHENTVTFVYSCIHLRVKSAGEHHANLAALGTPKVVPRTPAAGQL